MDTELLMALIFLWTSTTLALIIFLSMWFRNRGETFHPHSIEVDNRHPMFLAVGDKTLCKPSFVVKSISAFVAPRGSSSNKHFTALIIIMSVSGMFGTLRWNAIQDASFEETRLAFVGFGALILTAAFETDVSNGRFLEDKLMVTSWLIQKLELAHLLPFSLEINCLEFRQFLRKSKLYRYYEEDIVYADSGDHIICNSFPYVAWWSALHTAGAIIYVCFIPTALMWNEQDGGTALGAALTWLAFFVFCFGGYLTGTYLPVISPLQCIVLQWNPFYMSFNFLEELYQAVLDYDESSCNRDDSCVTDCISTTHSNNNTPTSSRKCIQAVYSNGVLPQKELTSQFLGLSADETMPSTSTLRHRKQKKKKKKGKLSKSVHDISSKTADVISGNFFLRFARNHPVEYLQFVGHLMVMFEMVAVLLPSIAIGINWITALCQDNPVNSFLDLLQDVFTCFFFGSECDLQSHCILRDVKT